MGVYLGEINIKNEFYNFRPIYCYENKHFTPLDPEDKLLLLPESDYRDINFYFSGYPIQLQEMFVDRQLILLEFELDDLEDNFKYSGERNKTGYKVDISKNRNKIQTLSDIGYYYLIDSKYIPGNYKTNPVLIITDENVYEEMKVVLRIPENNNLVLGPFTVDWREKDEQFIVKTNYQNNKHLIWGFDFPDNIEQHTATFNSAYSYSTFYPGHNEGQAFVRINTDTKTCKEVAIDVLPDEKLLKGFRDSLDEKHIIDGKLDLTNIEQIVMKNTASLLTDIPNDIREQRVSHLQKILTDTKDIDDSLDQIADVLSSMLKKYEGTERFDGFINSLMNSPGFMLEIQRYKDVVDRIERKEAELQELTKKVEAVKEQVQIAKEEADSQSKQLYTEGLLKELNVEILEKKSELDSTEIELASLKEKLHTAKDVVNLQEHLRLLNEDVNYKAKRSRELDLELISIEERLDTIFSNSTEKALGFTFDGMLSSKMIRQAAEWESEQESKNYIRAISKIQDSSPIEMESEELISHLCAQVGKYRPGYDKNTILNIIICIVQGFLTVFSGEPGTGKTSICNIIAHVSGLNLPKDKLGTIEGINLNRYIPISVERGWTSKRDFIGYYNPLNKQFDRSNRLVFDGLKILDYEFQSEKNSTDLPFLILLDEANLSPMEYYWADFMGLCDYSSNNRTINLGEDYTFQIPNSLRFVATINNDHTTESLSPRLIDRAWVIRLPHARLGTIKDTKLDNGNVVPIAWSSFKSTFDVDDTEIVPMDGTAKEIYDSVISQLRSAKAPISVRTDSAIRRYWSVAQNVFEDETEYATNSSVVALDYAISQRILPRINGSGQSYGELLESFYKLLSEKNLRLSAERLEDILRRGIDAMHYYQYF